MLSVVPMAQNVHFRVIFRSKFPPEAYGEAYLNLLQDEFYPEFLSLPNQSELMFL